jgi:hypothetical protein
VVSVRFLNKNEIIEKIIEKYYTCSIKIKKIDEHL